VLPQPHPLTRRNLICVSAIAPFIMTVDSIAILTLIPILKVERRERRRLGILTRKGTKGVENEQEKINKRRKPVPERSADSQIREIELKPISASLGDAAKWRGTPCSTNCQIYIGRPTRFLRILTAGQVHF
jgi:hypothetical protein